MAETGISIKDNVNSKADQWRERMEEQERSGVTVKQFCQERGFSAWSFYDWRKRLRESAAPVRFALVERKPESRKPASADVEIVFAGGEQLRIRSGVDTATLRMVIEALRA